MRTDTYTQERPGSIWRPGLMAWAGHPRSAEVRKSIRCPSVVKTEDRSPVHFDLEGAAIAAQIMSCMKRIMFVALLVVALTPGCSKKSEEPGVSNPNAASQPAGDQSPAAKPSEAPASAPIAAPIPPPVATYNAPTNAIPPADVGELTAQLRRFVAVTHRTPKTFEEFVALAKIQAPQPPAGKKYIISPRGQVMLVDR
jgi:hypothetical protein